MKITKKAIKDAFESHRRLQTASYRDWDDDPEARLILAVRKIHCEYQDHQFQKWVGMTKTQILEELYSRLWKKDYSELQKTNRNINK
jgi:hypothetical protein|tara:strand:- start:296 stop:556 length:261 start_codon:yes stop_codon:yes gene_type:complete